MWWEGMMWLVLQLMLLLLLLLLLICVIGVGVLEPALQQGLELAHVLEAELEGLEAADGGLAEDVAVEGAEGEPHVGLGEAQLDAALLELLGEGLQIV